MVDFRIDIEIKSFDYNLMLEALQWIRTNYGTDLTEAEAIGVDKQITLFIIYDNFNDAIDALTAFKNQFDQRLDKFNLKMVK